MRTIPHGRIDVVELDDAVVGRMTYEPGWRWSVDVRPIAGTDTCQYHHLGVSLSGRLRAQMADGAELEIAPGDVFEIPPGHDAWMVGDEPWVSVDFESMRSYGRQLDDRAEGLGLAIRAGVHTGEVQAVADDVRGIAVHTAARIMAEAGSGEILVSATARCPRTGFTGDTTLKDRESTEPRSTSASAAPSVLDPHQTWLR